MPVARSEYRVKFCGLHCIVTIPLFKVDVHRLVSVSGLVPSFLGQK